jgi:hypothetical protein
MALIVSREFAYVKSVGRVTYSEPFLREHAEVERATGPDAIAEHTQQPARLQAVERLHERVLADRVVDDGHALAAGELLVFATKSSRV